ncbi:2TM domain-containing protein [Aquimarina algicola]|uniref:2TM domain-containing protein n=2 Tax=Aquimarina algicola TaxID=2589995 RepID=A0A504J4N4_9FLAO|nr:2TM domain-containing protein [Aquimarina algicola]
MRDLEQQHRYEKAKKRVENEKGFYTHLTVYIVINIILLITNADIIDDGLKNLGSWHLYITPTLWGIGLFFHGFSVFGKYKIFSRKWEERKIKELMDRDNF